jgi:mRNA interferase MazF
VLVLTRELVRPHLATVTVAPITTTVRGLSSEVPLDAANGLRDRRSSAATTSRRFPPRPFGAQIGVLLDRQEATLSRAIQAAFDLD